MKQTIVTGLMISSLIIFSAPSFAQKDTVEHREYVIKNNNDTLYGKVRTTFRFGDVTEKSVKLIIDSTHEKIKLRIHEIKGYRKDDKNYETIPWQTSFHDTLEFAEVIVKGFLTLYEIAGSGGGPLMAPSSGGGPPMMVGGGGSPSFELLKKGNSAEYVEIKYSGFWKQLNNYFHDCKELQDRIGDKKYGRGDVDRMVRFYNHHCAQK